MSVCKFFLENRCRYGENCRFEHPRGGGQRSLFSSGGGGSSWRSDGSNQKVTFRDSFGTASGNQDGNNQFKWVSNQHSSSQPGTQQTSALDLVNALPKEMEMWEKTKMWPFSCIAVEKDSPSLPDFTDTSTEELRLEYYEAQKSGNIAAYNQRVQNLAMEFQNKRMQLKHMSMDVKQKLAAIIDQARKNKANQLSSKPSSGLFGQQMGGSTSQSSGGLFSQLSGGSLFGKPSTFGTPSSTSQVSSLFGKPQTTGGLFGSSPSSNPQGQSSIFGSGASSVGSVLGGQSMNTSQPQTPSNVFGSSQPQQQSSSLFGGGSAATPQTGLFGKPATTGSNGVFGSPAASSSSPMTSGLFGGSKPAPGQGLLGAAPSATLPFGTPPNQASAQAGFFGNAAASPGPSGGGGGLLPTPGSTGGAGLFGKGSGLLPAPSGGLFGKGPQVGTGQAGGAGLFGKGLPAGGGGVTGSGLFGKGASAGDAVTGVTGGASSDPHASKGRYSLMSELTEQDIEAFKAPSFTLGKLPIKPPPRELIMI